MLEIEMKFPVADIAKLESKLSGLHAKESESISEADHYFNAPDRDFVASCDSRYQVSKSIVPLLPTSAPFSS